MDMNTYTFYRKQPLHCLFSLNALAVFPRADGSPWDNLFAPNRSSCVFSTTNTRPLPPLPRRLSASRERSHRRQLSDLVLRLPQSSSLLLLQQHVKNVARPHYSLPALSRSNALRLCFSAQITTGTAFWPTTGFAALYTSRAPFLA